MSKGKNNILVSILLLIFVGQAMASTSVKCLMPMGSDMDVMMQSMSEMEHSSSMPASDMSMMGHDMSASAMLEIQSSTNMLDCCSDGKNCNMTSCTFLALSNILQIQPPTQLKQSVVMIFSMTPRQASSSLFRPPISS